MTRLLLKTGLVNSVNLALGLLTGVLTARSLPVSDRGVFVGVTVWSVTISWLALAGFQEAVVSSAKGSQERAVAIESATRGTALRDVAMACALLLPVLLLIGRGHGRGALVASALAVLIVPLHVAGQRAMALHRVASGMGVWNVLRLVPAVSYAVALSTLAAVDHLDLQSALGSLVFSYAVASAAAVHWRPRSLSRGNVPPEFARTRRFGLQVMLADLPSVTNQKADQLLLALLLSPATLSRYSVAISLSVLLQVVAVTSEHVLFPMLMRQEHVGISLRRLLLVAGAIALTVAVTLALIAETALRLVYGSAYATSASAARILLIGGVAVVLTAVMASAAKARDWVSSIVWAQVAGVLVTVSVLPYAVQRLGIEGAALTSACSYVVTTITLFALLRRRGMSMGAIVEPSAAEHAHPLTGAILPSPTGLTATQIL